MISYMAARSIVLEQAGQTSLAQEDIKLQDIDGRICAQDITAPLSIQPFDNAAMDGFALRCADIAGAAPEVPVTLNITATIAAGDPLPEQGIEQGQAVRIMTGAPVPPGADSIVPVEQALMQGDQVTLTAAATKNAHIRFAGEDFCKGAPVLAPGMRLTSAHILPLATLGIGSVRVFKRPRVAFLSTGRELVDNLSQSLQSGQIYNSNRPYAAALLQALGADIIAQATIADDPAVFARTLQDILAQKPDLIISSGAVSAGAFDFVRNGLEEMGAEILFHRIKLKPGKPNLFARFPGGPLYFGLPGNPVATAAGLRFMAEPALRAMTGQALEKPVYAKATDCFEKKAGLHMLLKAQVENWDDGLLTVGFPDAQASFMVGPFLTINGWACIGEGITKINAGDLVEIYPLLPDGRLI